MAYRLEIDIAFNQESEMKSMINLIQEMRDKLLKQEGALPIPCKVKYHECNHDIGGACGKSKTIEFDGTLEDGFPAEDIVPESVKTKIKAPVEEEKNTLKAQIASLTTEKESNVKTPTGAIGTGA